MTKAQEILRLGFLASLRVRGVLLTFRGRDFQGLVQPITPEDVEDRIAQADSIANEIVTLREHVSALRIGIGDHIEAEDGSKHRVTAIRDNPQSIKVHFICRSKA